MAPSTQLGGGGGGGHAQGGMPNSKPLKKKSRSSYWLYMEALCMCMMIPSQVSKDLQIPFQSQA